MRIDRLGPAESYDRLADRQPGSRLDLRRRLDGLANDHPSSPYHQDGSAKPPVADLGQYQLPESATPDRSEPDRPPPLTDAEHREHVSEIRRRLDQARATGLATRLRHAIDSDGDAWDRARRISHKSIIEDLYARASGVPAERRAIIAGGLGGAGKSTVLGKHPGIDRSQYMTIDPDMIKEEMASRGLVPRVEGLSPMEASDLVHEESSHIARQLAHRAQTDGKNLIWDITMSSQSSTERRIDELRSSGYTHIEGIFVDIPVEISVTRADARYREGHERYRVNEGLGGRYVPHESIRAQSDPGWGSLNRKAFESVKPMFDKWSIYDNSVDGRGPVLVDENSLQERDL